ncbi:DUF790 family protein [bacterium]|nr:DUF790 family protein [bacterium]
MLSGNLNLSRFRNGFAYPQVLKPDTKNLNISSSLVELFANSVNRKRFEIEEEIKAFYIEKVNPKIVQGFARILFNRCEFSHANDSDPVLNREKIFSVSASYWKDSASPGISIDRHKISILQKANIKSRSAAEETEVWLFGDVLSNQKVVEFREISAEDLVHRFNIEQVQGLLLHAQSLEFKIKTNHDAAFRQVFQMLKFFQLMYEVRDAEKEWLTIRIDGPASILENARSYGLEIANFFPAILLLTIPWTLSATLKIPGRHRRFTLELTDGNPYRTFYRERGVWKNEKIEQLVRRFNDKYPDQYDANIENQLIPLRNNRFLIPDLIIRNQEDINQLIMVEWIQYVSDAKIQWLKKVAVELPDNYVFAVKGKKEKFAQLEKKLRKNLLLFTKELTAPALLKKLKEF